MGRWLLMAVLGAAFLLPLGWSQRRGGSSAGFAARPSMAVHGGGAGFRPPSAGVPRGQLMHPPRTIVHGGSGFHHRPFVTTCWGRPCRVFPWRVASWWYPYSGLWYGSPGWYDNDSYSAPNYAPADSGVDSGRIEQQQAEIDRLHEEIAELREERDVRAGPPRPPAETDSQPTAFVFRDKHMEEVKNYAIVGESLWVLSSGKARRIPLSELDVAATKKANEDRGVDFKTPR